ncbi:hypothetical protein [Roseibium sediminis]|nr:hypothetical protein [Roseibium sediminis]
MLKGMRPSSFRERLAFVRIIDQGLQGYPDFIDERFSVLRRKAAFEANR